MKIFICCSKHIYDKVPAIKKELESKGHVITLPNSFDAPMKEEEMKVMGSEEHRKWKAGMLRLQKEKVAANDAVLVLNMEKNGQSNYVGGATFLETFKAFELDKKIFFYNPLPDNFLQDELLAMGPLIINGDLSLIK
jgi:hypothetical protein